MLINNLIKLYFHVCDKYKEQLYLEVQRQSNNHQQNIVLDNIDGIICGYITSISNDTTSNIISNPIVIINNTTIITQTSTLTDGTYNIIYTAYDSSGNSTNINRTLIIN